MNKKLINFAFDSMLGAILSAVLGLVLLIWPSMSGKFICYGLGIGLVIQGAYRIIRYFRSGAAAAMVRHDLSSGILSLVTALVFLLSPQLIISLIPTLLGLFLVMGAARGAQTAWDLHRMGAPRWAMSIVAALVLAVLGILVLMNPFSTGLVLMRFVGASILLESISLIAFSASLSKRQKVFYSEVGNTESDTQGD